MGLTGGMAAMGIMSIGNSIAQASAQKTQADFTANQFAINKEIGTEQATEAKARGDIQASEMEREGVAQEARQRVAAAAGGADVNSGSAMSLRSDTAWQASQNALMIKNNAWRTAWGYQTEAMDYGFQGEYAKMAGDNAYTTTLIAGGMSAVGYGTQAYGTYQKYNG